MRQKKKTSEEAKLKVANRLLVRENAKLKKCLSEIIAAWRDQDMKSAERCFSVCKKGVTVLANTDNFKNSEA